MTDTRAQDSETLAAGALEWILATARETGSGLAWTARTGAEAVSPALYNGAAGIVAALLEGWRHFGDDRYADAALRGARGIEDAIDGCGHNSLYMGLAGLAFGLHTVHDLLGDAAAGAAATRALDLVRANFDGTRWHEHFEMMKGNAGIALGALACGDTELAVLAAEPYLRTAEPTAHGVQWVVRDGSPSRLHHLSHGTLGVAYALASVGRAAGRADLTDLALLAAADVVSRDEAGPDGFLVPHSDPQDRPELIQRYTYGWCHGPAGDAQAFRLLRDVTGDPAWPALGTRCWHTVAHSGLPERRFPGFWDNSGRCCGTAGVLALALDRHAEGAGDPDFTGVLLADLAARAVTGADGTYWRNTEHKATPSTLPPEPGWAMGNAGIARELLRHARLATGRDQAYAVRWPDHPPVTAPDRGVPGEDPRRRESRPHDPFA